MFAEQIFHWNVLAKTNGEKKNGTFTTQKLCNLNFLFSFHEEQEPSYLTTGRCRDSKSRVKKMFKREIGDESFYRIHVCDCVYHVLWIWWLDGGAKSLWKTPYKTMVEPKWIQTNPWGEKEPVHPPHQNFAQKILRRKQEEKFGVFAKRVEHWCHKKLCFILHMDDPCDAPPVFFLSERRTRTQSPKDIKESLRFTLAKMGKVKESQEEYEYIEKDKSRRKTQDSMCCPFVT